MKRHETSPPSPWPRPAAALRAVLREGYTRADLRADVLAGRWSGSSRCRSRWRWRSPSGVPPQHGLYTAIVAGG